MQYADATQVYRSTPAVKTAVTHAGSIATGSTKASFATPLRVATRHANVITVLITSTAAVTVFVRRWGASRVIEIDDAGTAVAANTPIGIVLNGDTAGNGAGVGIGDEAELVITNASGSTATITAQLWAR